MKTMLELITTEMEAAFEKAGYDKELAKVTLSNRPDLCEYQCNGAMAGAKKYKKAPFMIAEDVAVYLKESSYFETVEVVKPGFINLKLAPQSVADYLNQMSETEKLGVEEAEEPKTIMIDYGGPNVAKPLHVGHLRSAIIGESVKRITRFKGNKVIGDIHLGDWGYQMGLIITELKKRKPERRILMKILRENIRRKLRLRSANWRRYIRQQVHMQKKTKNTGKKRCMRHICSRTATEDTERFGITS